MSFNFLSDGIQLLLIELLPYDVTFYQATKRFFAGSWEVEVDRQGAGKLAVPKHTTTITLLSPCIILILPPSGQVIPSSPKRFLPTITPLFTLEPRADFCPVVADACNPRH